jgi:hypothetical protein
MLNAGPQTLELIAGFAFLFVAVIGGGITAKEVTLPQVPVWGRVTAALVGLALVGIGILVPTLTTQPANAPTGQTHSCRSPKILPNVSNAQPETSARDSLTAAGLFTVTTEPTFISGAPKGVVVDQSPPPGTVLCPRDPIILRVTQ